MESVRKEIYNSVHDSVYNSVHDSVYNSVHDSVYNSVEDPVWNSVGDIENVPVHISIYDVIMDFIKNIKKEEIKTI